MYCQTRFMLFQLIIGKQFPDVHHDLLSVQCFLHNYVAILLNASTIELNHMYIHTCYSIQTHINQLKMYSLIGRSMQIEVILNVYDLNPSMNQSLYGVGLGFYHSGIQISSCQYTFAGHPGSHTGVMEVSPKVNHPNFRQSIVLGKTTLTHLEINRAIDALKQKFPGNSYDVVRKNCNTFTNALSEAIFKKPIPGWVNRMANMGKFIYESSDFIMNKPYNTVYQTSANELGVVIQEKQDIFGKGSGVMIG